MTKSDTLRYTGSMQQLAYARRIKYYEGRASELNAIEVANGPMRFVIMLDKCMDISELSWRGECINFIGKTGLNGRNPFDTHGAEAQRSIMGGLFFTCGFENICAPFIDEKGKEYPMHGRLRTSPAEHVSVEAGWVEENYVIKVSGDIREAELFGENMLLHRTITTVYGKPEITVNDEIYNEAFRSEPMMLMYHCNFGYPFLTEHTRLISPSVEVKSRDEISRKVESNFRNMDRPKDNAAEMVYLHKLAADKSGETFTALVDDHRELGIELNFNNNALPEFGQWKSTGSGDYVMGLEPSNAKIYGRKYAQDNNVLPMLAPQSKAVSGLKFRIIEGKDEIKLLDEKSKKLRGDK